ncbi:MAG: acyl carrier protein [Rhodospirillales bacterium]|nr:acyl carrier protein [Rhodospirillales bacterium]
MTDDDILQRLIEIFRHVFDSDDLVLKPDMTSDDIEGWDSMSTITLAMEIERRFRIKIKMADMESLKSVKELMALIQSCLPVSAP